MKSRWEKSVRLREAIMDILEFNMASGLYPDRVSEHDVLMLSSLEGYSPEYCLEYYFHWSSFEEYGWFSIWSRDGQYYVANGGYSVMDDEHVDILDLDPISEEDALSEIIHFDNEAEKLEKELS